MTAARGMIINKWKSFKTYTIKKPITAAEISGFIDEENHLILNICLEI